MRNSGGFCNGDPDWTIEGPPRVKKKRRNAIVSTVSELNAFLHGRIDVCDKPRAGVAKLTAWEGYYRTGVDGIEVNPQPNHEQALRFDSTDVIFVQHSRALPRPPESGYGDRSGG